MNTTVEVICYRSKTLANGELPLMLRLTKNGKRKYISLHLSVNPIYWDFVKNKPKRNCPNKEHISTLIEQQTKEKEYTLNTLVQRAENPVIKQTFGSYFNSESESILLRKHSSKDILFSIIATFVPI